MTKNRYSFLALLVFTLTVFGCRSCETIDSSKLDPSEIYQEYSISASAKTRVTAEFRVSGPTGTTIALVPPAMVEYNGKTMDESLRTVLSGTFYSDEADGFVGAHTFVFTDSSGKRFTNSITLDPIEIRAENIEINKAAPTIVVPLSRGLADGESINLQITSHTEPPTPPTNATNSNTNVRPGPDYSVEVSGAVDATAKTLTLQTEQLRNFAQGKAKMSIVVQGSRVQAEFGIRGGNISYTIKSPYIPANVL